MTVSQHNTALRWLLLCVLTFAVMTMHHVASAPHHPEFATPAAAAAVNGTATAHVTTPHDQPPDESAPDAPLHGVLHLCLAVLLSVAGLILSVRTLRTAFHAIRAPGTSGRLGASRRRSRPPDASGRALLASVCVLRI